MEHLKAALSEVVSKGYGIEVFFLVDSGSGPTVKKADIDAVPQQGLADMFVKSITDTILLDDNVSLIDLSSADDRKDTIYRYDLEAVPIELQQLTEVIASDDFEIFSFASDSLNDLEGIIILLGNESRQVALYKHQYPITLLRKDKSFGLIRSRASNRFTRLDEDVLRINQKFEFFQIDGVFYIVDLKALERFFGFHDAIKNVAVQGIANIEQSGLLESVGVLTDRLDDISFSRKLVKAASKSPVLNVIPNRDVIEFAKTHPALRGKIAFSASGDKIALKSKVSQNLFLKLLNDDFLQSELTKRYYASLAKDAVEMIRENSD